MYIIHIWNKFDHKLQSLFSPFDSFCVTLPKCERDVVKSVCISAQLKPPSHKLPGYRISSRNLSWLAGSGILCKVPVMQAWIAPLNKDSYIQCLYEAIEEKFLAQLNLKTSTLKAGMTNYMIIAKLHKFDGRKKVPNEAILYSNILHENTLKFFEKLWRIFFCRII